MNKRVCLIKDPRCGTRAGALAHIRFGEYQCPPCYEANKAYHRAHKHTHNRARQRALSAMRKDHAEEFTGLYEQARRNVEAEIEAKGEQVLARTVTVRSWQRAMTALGKLHPKEYQRVLTDKLLEIMMEEDDDGGR